MILQVSGGFEGYYERVGKFGLQVKISHFGFLQGEKTGVMQRSIMRILSTRKEGKRAILTTITEFPTRSKRVHGQDNQIPAVPLIICKHIVMGIQK